MNADLTLDALRPEDVQPLARLHRVAFPGFFLSTLGEPFLVQLYRGYLNDPAAVTMVARRADGSIAGAVVGTTEPAGFFGRLLRRRWAGFALAAARAVVVTPRATPRLLRALRYRGDTPPDASGALLSSICVDASTRDAGIGGRLLEAWLQEVRHRDVHAAFLTTDAESNEAVNRFYHRRGWTLVDRYTTREGRLMNRYSITVVDR